MKVNEIFYSLQGEGRWTGTPAVFVRLSGCNLSCDFCDTNHEAGIEMTELEILEGVLQFPTDHIVITGGEPTLQLTESLVDLFHTHDKFVHIETNGARPISQGLIDSLDWITVSPKYGQTPNIQRIDEIKVVYDYQHPEYVEKAEAVQGSFVQCRYLQPCDRQDEGYNAHNLASCINYIMEHPTWKLSLQTHKTLNLR